MSLLLLLIFLSLVFAGVAWGVRQKSRYYQFPTLFCATWLLNLGPQAIGAVVNKSKYPESLHKDYGLELALFFCLLCAALGLIGYAWGGTVPQRLFRSRSRSYRRLFLAGVVLCAVGLWGAYELAQLGGGFVAQFTKGGHYALEWRGASVKYTFFTQLMYPGLLLVFLPTLYHPSILRWIIACFCLVYPVAVVVFLGRRSVAGLLTIMILLGVFFTRRWAPPRFLFVALLVLACVATIVAPAYRAKSQYGLDMQELREIGAPGMIANTFRGERYSEFDTIVYGCAAVNRGLAFDYGSGIYNAVITVLVPRQLAGEKFKQGLFILPGKDVSTLVERYYDWSIPPTTNPTGPFDVFARFWFFGGLVYLALGYVYRCLWTAAYSQADVGAQLWYTATALWIPMSVFGSVSLLAPSFLVALTLFAPTLYFARGDGLRGAHSGRRTETEVRHQGFCPSAAARS